MKRNVTVSLDEATARWVRVEAAKRDTSVSAFLAELLHERMAEESRYERAMQQYLDGLPRVLKERGGYPPRAALHERR